MAYIKVPEPIAERLTEEQRQREEQQRLETTYERGLTVQEFQRRYGVKVSQEVPSDARIVDVKETPQGVRFKYLIREQVEAPKPIYAQVSEFFHGGWEEHVFGERKSLYPDQYVGGPVGGPLGLEETIPHYVWLGEASVGKVEAAAGRPTYRTYIASWEELGLSYALIGAGLAAPYAWRGLKWVGGKAKSFILSRYTVPTRLERLFFKKVAGKPYVPKKPLREPTFKILTKTKRGWERTGLKIKDVTTGGKKVTTWKPRRVKGEYTTPFKKTTETAFWTPPKKVVSGRQISLQKQMPHLAQPLKLKQPHPKMKPTIPQMTTAELSKKMQLKPTKVPNLVKYSGPAYQSVYAITRPKQKLKPFPEQKFYEKTHPLQKGRQKGKQIVKLDQATRVAIRQQSRSMLKQQQRLGQQMATISRQVLQQRIKEKPGEFRWEFPKMKPLSVKKLTHEEWRLRKHRVPSGKQILRLVTGK